MALQGLIVGLGNPGQKYEGTRHNTGFMFLDELMEHMAGLSSQSGSRFRCELWKGSFKGIPGEWLLAKPQTFMNLSGDCVQPLSAWHRISPSSILVIHDELDLLPGRMKFKCGGGNAGHNGLKSITERLGTPDFYRLRIGIGRASTREDTIGWVLGRPNPEQRAAFIRLLPDAIACVQAFASGNTSEAARIASAHKDTSSISA